MPTDNMLRYRRRVRVKWLHERGMSLDEISNEIQVPRIVAYKDARQMGLRPRYTSEPTGVIAVLGNAPCPVTALELAMASPESYRRELARVQHLLFRLRVRGVVASFRSGRYAYWTLAERMPMNFEDVQELILRGVPFGDVYPHVREEDHAALREWFVREPKLKDLFPRNAPKVPVPTGSGNVCPKCGNPLIRDGKCELCVCCGETVGSCS